MTNEEYVQWALGITAAGEKRFLGPNGRPIRVVVDENGSTIVTTDDMQAVRVRPRVVTYGTQVRRPRWH